MGIVSRCIDTSSIVVLLCMLAKSNAQCDLDCNPDGDATLKDDNGSLLCVLGDADFSNHVLSNGLVLPFHVLTKSPGGYHCICGPKHTGLMCGRSFEECNDGRNNKCYHNGECRDDAVDAFGNPTPICDCSDAVTKAPDNVRHVGQFCEHPVEKCTEKEPLGNLYCLNDGACKVDAEKYAAAPCECREGFFGPHCEFTDEALLYSYTLECQNGGTGMRGLNDFSRALFMFGKSGFDEQDYQYCECPDNHEGRFCEIYLNDNGGELCGNAPCQHGGECVKIVNDESGTTERRCDCSAANNNNLLYGGRYCQHASTSFCSLNKDQNGNSFCVNDGVCRKGESHLGCDCPAGFSGPICDIVLDGTEATLKEVEEEAKCELDCGDGNCRKGIRDSSLLLSFGDELSFLADDTNPNFEYCVCPPGFIGPRCEVKIEICGTGERLCFHGSKCVEFEDSKACDCDTTFNSLTQFAGAFCQFEATSFCTESGQPATGGQASKAFCVNGGDCLGTISDDDRDATHPGCACGEGFEGDHCEYLIGSEFNPNNSSVITSNVPSGSPSFSPSSNVPSGSPSFSPSTTVPSGSPTMSFSPSTNVPSGSPTASFSPSTNVPSGSPTESFSPGAIMLDPPVTSEPMTASILSDSPSAAPSSSAAPSDVLSSALPTDLPSSAFSFAVSRSVVAIFVNALWSVWCWNSF